MKGGAVDALLPFRASRRLLTSAVREAQQRKQSAMNGEHAAILNITLDCADARAQASFWAAAITRRRPRRSHWPAGQITATIEKVRLQRLAGRVPQARPRESRKRTLERK